VNLDIFFAIFFAPSISRGVALDSVVAIFNEVLSQDEHLGPKDRTEAQIAGF
jgi:hypothetical protein